MTQSENVFGDLLVDRFLELPWHIIGEICDLLPSDVIMETLLKTEKLRSFLIERYFSQEICLYLPKPFVPGVEHPRGPDKQTITDIIGYDNIVKFFRENPDIVPRKYTILPDWNFMTSVLAEFDDLLRESHGTLSQAPDLVVEFMFPDYESHDAETPSQDLVDLILSFRNLASFQAWFRPYNPDSAGWRNLRKLVYQDIDDTGWSEIVPPPSLTELEIVMCDEWGVEEKSYTIPYDDLYSMLWEGTLNSDRVVRCPALTSLSLVNCGLKSIDFSIFQPTLEKIDLCQNLISKLGRTGSIAQWPKNLKILDLSDNNIGDEMLKQISDSKWPPLLEDLYLGENRFTSLKSLKNLPSSLKVLDLRGSENLKSLHVSHNHDEYPFFAFPEFLETLTLESCENVSWEIFDNDEAVPVSHRMRFPPNLKSLNLSYCNIESLACFVFPSTLKSLNLDRNRLISLTTYDVWSGGVELVSWKQLKNLRELNISSNRIQSLEGWVPPSSIQKLNLSNNMLGSLSRECFSLFDEKFHEFTDNLRVLDLYSNGIETLDHDFYLPRNLMFLDLSRNELSKFEFHDYLASHENLIELDLEYNPLCRIFVEHPEKKYASNLKKLDLRMWEGRQQWEISVDELNAVFEQLGLRARERTKELSKEHTFH